jgi:hypothetical protein
MHGHPAEPEQVVRNGAATSSVIWALVGFLCIGLAFERGLLGHVAFPMVPISGVCGLIMGVSGIRRARSLRSGRTIAALGLLLSCALLLTTIIVVAVWAIALRHLSSLSF